MDILKYLNRIKLMDNLIRRRATGTSREFAEKLNISRSTLMEYINLLRKMGAPVAYDKFRNSYYYLFPCKLKIGFESKMLTEKELMSINKKSLKKFCEILKVR
ncbi:HTH domain-containing protein [Agaribacillus aureus]|uniref:HTH domain-containing protein n=1 Tax=Agaribacillus aureus TaxID=3051825 RepID=UPI003211954E